MRTYGLIGYPLSHSFSQSYFTEKFQREGIRDAVYRNFPIASIRELPEVLAACPDLRGLNVTIPYKFQVFEYITDFRSPIRACNCIRIEGDRLTGFNTDIAGFEQSLLPGIKPSHARALVLGKGGAAEAVFYVLEKIRIPYWVVGRTPGPRVDLLYQDLTEQIIADHPLIINTTPVGMYPETEAAPPIPYGGIGPGHYLYDLIYNPAKTKFLEEGEKRGARICNGADMLVIQAEESWRIWNQNT